jgi:ligand-binding SRPBCC domain-containing protein
MPIVTLKTEISAPIERVFDLSRSIDLHTKTASQTRETAVGGRTSGLIELGETVTWNAVHFGFRLKHTSEIVELERPAHFRDSMIEGVFARLDHDHFFEETKNGTLMHDVFDFESPLWVLGKLVELVFLENYMKGFLERRNSMIKAFAEGDEWKKFLPDTRSIFSQETKRFLD